MFQVSYPESAVLVSALTIAIAEYENRMASIEHGPLREETRTQLTHSQAMLDRLLGRSGN